MATHSSILVWRIPWTEEPGGLQLMGSQTVRHDQVTEHASMHVLFSIVAAPIYIHTRSAQGFPFLHILSNIFCVDFNLILV